MKIWALTKLGFKECMRYKIVYFIFIMAVLFIFWGKSCNPGEIKGNDFFFNKHTRQNMAMAAAFHGIVIWSILLCGFISANVLSNEIEDGTAVMTLSRPLNRSSFIAGKLLSILIISVFNLFLLGGIFFVLFYIESNILNFRIFMSFSLMIFSLVMYGLMSMLLSLIVPRLVTPLLCIFIYITSVWLSLPFHFNKIKILWEPSETVKTLYDFLPRFGDLQFFGASLMTSMPQFNDLIISFCSIIIYCGAFWFIIVFLFNRRQIS